MAVELMQAKSIVDELSKCLEIVIDIEIVIAHLCSAKI